MATYKEIQEWVKKHYGFVPKTCWIADVKERCGFPVKPAPNRLNKNKRKHPCPANKVFAICQALRFFGMI
jgi:hypothetical protein